MSRPLVLVHGFTGSPESWAGVRRRLGSDERSGDPSLDDPGFTDPSLDGPALTDPSPDDPGSPHPPSGGTFAPALLGHDGTGGPPGIGTFEAEVDRLAAAIRQHGIRTAHLAGYSMGGRVSLGLLVRHPDLFASATLIATSPGLRTPGEREARAARDEGWARLLETGGLDTFVAAWEALPLFATQDRLPPAAAAEQRRIRRSHDPHGLARSLRVLGLARMPDYRPRLADMELPVRLVVGQRDARFEALGREMAQRLPRGTLTRVPDAGHNVVLECPAETVALIREDMA
jgi:2-succinyl-6-hydroxy-2,4-cyclohexadiene-1-carboxylate synthase